MRFKDRVVIISGGAAGMGMATALAFAKEGARVVINDVDEENLKKAADAILSIGGVVTAVPGDVTRSECVNAVAGKALEQYGRIDILFNYVGGSPGNAPLAFFMDESEDYWDRIIDLNLKSTMIFSRAVLDAMIKQKYGKIINTGAVAGQEGVPKLTAYSAVKGGVIAFTKALAKEMAVYNINVNCICPGPVATPGFMKVWGNEMSGAGAMAGAQQPEDVADVVLFLASEEARKITGQILTVGGGGGPPVD